ncbi:MAG: hypothetical protein V4525_11080 [Pseudomonadota bacterium]
MAIASASLPVLTPNYEELYEEHTQLLGSLMRLCKKHYATEADDEICKIKGCVAHVAFQHLLVAKVVDRIDERTYKLRWDLLVERKGF